jgi:hypothetical protein
MHGERKTIRHLLLLLPCAAVFTGLDIAGSAWSAILLYHAILVALLLAGRGKTLIPGLLDGWNGRLVIIPGVLSVLCGPALVLLWPLMDNTPSGMGGALAEFGLQGMSWWLFAAYYVSVHPILEEIFWRGTRGRGSRGIVFADAAFAAYHAVVLRHFLALPWIALVFVVLTAVSWLWRRVAEHCEGLAIPLISHALADLGIMAAAFYLADH